MTDKTATPKRLTPSNTKQEMLDAYNQVVEQLRAKREAEARPEDKLEEKAVKKAVQAADALAAEGVVKSISELRSNVGRMLGQISDRLEEEVQKYEGVKKAIEAKQSELQEIYEIQKVASTLAALIETQRQKREEFEAEMAERKEQLAEEIQVTRSEWEKERKLHDAEIKERDAAEFKRREREKEEYKHAFAREQQLARDQFADEKSKVEREWSVKRAEMEKDLMAREQSVVAREAELAELRGRVDAFPREQETAVQKAVKEASAREANAKEELLKREFAGERNVLTTRISSLEQTVREQGEQIARLSQQAEKAYVQVQDLAVKAIEGSASQKALSNLQQMLAEGARKSSQEK